MTAATSTPGSTTTRRTYLTSFCPARPELVVRELERLLVAQVGAFGDASEESHQLPTCQHRLALLQVIAKSVLDNLRLAAISGRGQHLGSGQDISVQVEGGLAAACLHLSIMTA